MKLKYIFSVIAGLVLAVGMTGCDDEKDLVIYEGNLPIKTSTLFMVGDATPNGWSIDAPTPLTASEEDPLVFTWEGGLNAGEMKLCLTTGSWDAGFIRPESNGTEISKTAITDAKFAMWAGDPDNKWKVTEAGKYKLTFDLRNWTMSTEYLGDKEQEPVVFEPIETDVLYLVGEAAPSGWNIDAPTQIEKKSKYIFEYEGELKDIVFKDSPDDKWVVEDAGNYRLTFDLEHGTVNAEYLGEAGGGDEPGGDNEPIETETLFMIGDATPNGWSMDNASEFTKDANNPYVFTWTGNLNEGNMKACLVKDGTFSCPFLRPSKPDVEISSAGVAASDFVFTTEPDDKWKITEAGNYTITFDLEHWTISVVKN